MPGRLDGVKALFTGGVFFNDPAAWVVLNPFVALMPKACLTLAALAGVWKAFRLGESENTLGFLWSHFSHPKMSKEHFPLTISSKGVQDPSGH